MPYRFLLCLGCTRDSRQGNVSLRVACAGVGDYRSNFRGSDQVCCCLAHEQEPKGSFVFLTFAFVPPLEAQGLCSLVFPSFAEGHFEDLRKMYQSDRDSELGWTAITLS